MPTVAEQLRTARESKNLTVSHIAETTKIRGDHLRALEEGNYNVFTAPVYIRGFVRCYAGILKLDVPQVMATLDAELGGTEKFREPPPLSRRPRGIVDFATLQLSKIDWQKLLLALAVVVVIGVVVLGIFVWRGYKSNDPLKNLKPAVYQNSPGGSGNTIPLPSPSPRR